MSCDQTESRISQNHLWRCNTVANLKLQRVMKLPKRINGVPCLVMVYIQCAISLVNWDDVFINKMIILSLRNRSK